MTGYAANTNTTSTQHQNSTNITNKPEGGEDTMTIENTMTTEDTTTTDWTPAAGMPVRLIKPWIYRDARWPQGDSLAKVGDVVRIYDDSINAYGNVTISGDTFTMFYIHKDCVVPVKSSEPVESPESVVADEDWKFKIGNYAKIIEKLAIAETDPRFVVDEIIRVSSVNPVGGAVEASWTGIQVAQEALEKFEIAAGDYVKITTPLWRFGGAPLVGITKTEDEVFRVVALGLEYGRYPTASVVSVTGGVTDARSIDLAVLQVLSESEAAPYALQDLRSQLAESTRRTGVLQEQATTAQRELETFKGEVVRVAMQYARDHDWCSVVSEALEGMGLETPRATADVELTLRVRLTGICTGRAAHAVDESFVRDSISQGWGSELPHFDCDWDETSSEVIDFEVDSVDITSNFE